MKTIWTPMNMLKRLVQDSKWARTSEISRLNCKGDIHELEWAMQVVDDGTAAMQAGG